MKTLPFGRTWKKHRLFFKFKEFDIPCWFVRWDYKDSRNDYKDPNTYPKKFVIEDKILSEEDLGKKFKFFIGTNIYDDLMNGNQSERGFECRTLRNEEQVFWSLKSFLANDDTVFLWAFLFLICYSLAWFFFGHFVIFGGKEKDP